MAKIKTRDVVKKTVKTIDRAAIVAQKTKNTYVSTKDKIDRCTSDPDTNSNTGLYERTSNSFKNGSRTIADNTVHQLDKIGRKGVSVTKKNIRTIKDTLKKAGTKSAENATKTATEGVKNVARSTVKTTSTTARSASSATKPVNTAARSVRSATKSVSTTARSANSARVAGSKTIKTVEKATEKTIKQSARSVGKKAVKKTGKAVGKATTKTVKTAERTGKVAIKTAQKTAQATYKTAQVSSRAAIRAAQLAKATAKAAAVAAKVTAKAIIAAVKAAIAAIKALVYAIAAGGWIVIVVIIIICLIAAIFYSVFGIFFSGNDSGNVQTMYTAIQEIKTEYENTITETINSSTGCDYAIIDNNAAWKEVVATYAVKLNLDPNNPQEVVSMDDTKKEELKSIFWTVNSITTRTESITQTVEVPFTDIYGNSFTDIVEVTNVYLYVDTVEKTTDEISQTYGFTQEQKDYLTELLSAEYDYLWEAVLS